MRSRWSPGRATAWFAARSTWTTDGCPTRSTRVDLLTFFGATLEALEDGHELLVDELEVERRELVMIEIDGHQGDPIRRTRTIVDPVRLEIGPFRITGNLHRHPASQPLAALSRHQRFVPVTDATIDLLDGSRSTFFAMSSS